MLVTRANFEALLDAGKLYAEMRNGRFWRLRRNGQTQTWKRDATRIRVPVKAGLKSCSAITETDFDADGVLRNFAHVDNVPEGKRA